jgi:hypothetical protein
MKKFDFNKYCMDLLFKYVPEINQMDEPLKSEFEWYAKDLPLRSHSIYESILCPYFLMLIEHTDKKNKDVVSRIINLIEELACNEDFEVRCVASVSFCEPLLAQLKVTKDIEKYLLPKSLQLAREIGKQVFGFDSKTWKK